jgi:hypothetical protein
VAARHELVEVAKRAARAPVESRLGAECCARGARGDARRSSCIA